jgi:hypothetical protein
MLWTPNEIRIFYDGQEVISTNPNKPFPFTTNPAGYPLVPQVPEWLWLSVGASFGDGDFISQPVGILSDAKVDWVRVYKNSETLSLNAVKLPEIKVYPNPADSSLYIDKDFNLKEITIFNSQGIKIKTIRNLNSKDFIDVSNFISGIYIFQFHTNNGILAKKIIVR